MEKAIGNRELGSVLNFGVVAGARGYGTRIIGGY